MVANQSFEAGTAANQAILDVEAGEAGLPTFVPPNAGPPAPVAAKPKPKAKKKKRRCRRVHGKRRCRRARHH